MAITFEYVISAPGGMRLCHDGPGKVYEEQRCVINATKMWERTNKRYGPRNITSFLFNAFTEKGHGKYIKSFGENLYVDSGGLQIVTTKKKKLTDELKEEIYKEQMNGDYAMCFDDIPLHIDESSMNANSRTNHNGKTLMTKDLHSKGIATGKNIKAQCDAFRRANSNTKVVVIIQGNSPDDFKTFCDGIFSQLSDDDYPYLQGLAMADTCIGNGALETADMIAIIPELSCPSFLKKHIHLLGVGKMARLLPALALAHSGYLGEDVHISYDSSTITCTHRFGNYYGRHAKVLQFPQKCTKEQMRPIFDDIMRNSKMLGWDDLHDPERTLDLLTQSASKTIGKLSLDDEGNVDEEIYNDAQMMCHLFVASQVVNFVEDMNSLKTKDDIIIECRKRRSTYVELLCNVKTYDEYLHWRASAKRFGVKSKRIPRDVDEINTLESLFG